MKVGNFSVQQQNTVSDSAVSKLTQNNLSVQSSGGGLPQTLSSLGAGQVFEATITRDESGKITIHLANGESVTARMDGTVNLLENTATFFQVKSHQGNQLAIRAVTQDPSANPTIVRALAQAGVAIDDNNIQLVLEMMKNQLPIDAKSLAQMVRTAYANKGVDSATLAQMTKLGLPVTQENVTTFQQYASGNGDMIKNLDSMIKQLPQQLAAFDGSGISGKEILSALQEIFNGAQGEQQPVIQSVSVTGEGASSGNIRAEVEMFLTGNGSLNENGASDAVSLEHSVAMPSGNESGTAVATVGSIENGLADMENTSKDAMVQELLDVLNGLATTKQDGEGLLQAAETLTNGNTQNATAMIKNLIAGPDGFVRLLELAKQTELSDEQLQALFSNKGFAKLLADFMEKEWFLEPKQVRAKEVGEVYEKLQDQMNKLESLMQQLNPEAKSGQDAGQVRNNVAFINDLNQLYNYVQIPLKMANGHAKGDLYVYTDKRAMKQGKEELTAHLHLELEHLGMTDVYVSLRSKKLTTNFIMEKEESLDLVMSHMDELTRRLEEKGYAVKTEATLADKDVKEPDFFTEIMNKELPTVAVQRYSLDVIV